MIHTFRQLEEEHGVSANFGSTNYKISLNYSQIDTKDDDELAAQCRGLILAKPDGSTIKIDNWEDSSPGETIIIACPMFRFFNSSQGAAANINWNDSKLQCLEKLDGSCMIVGYDPFTNQWFVATRSRNEADVLINGSIFTFRTLFEKALFETTGQSFEEFTSKLNKRITYCYELTSPYARIVVKYDDTKITLLAARSLYTLKEIDINTIETFGVPRVSSYSFSNLNDIAEYVSLQDPLKHEGIVVLDSQFNRIKVKNINYVLLNKTRDTITNDRAFLNLILNEKVDDVWEVLPSVFQERTLVLKDLLSKFIVLMDNKFYSLQEGVNTKKDFALRVQAEKIWGSPMFQMYDKKLSFKGFLEINKGIKSDYSDGFLDKLLIEIGGK